MELEQQQSMVVTTEGGGKLELTYFQLGGECVSIRKYFIAPTPRVQLIQPKVIQLLGRLCIIKRLDHGNHDEHFKNWRKWILAAASLRRHCDIPYHDRYCQCSVVGAMEMFHYDYHQPYSDASPLRTLEMNYAAIEIQKRFRGFIGKRWYMWYRRTQYTLHVKLARLPVAVTTIQRFFRGHLIRKVLNRSVAFHSPDDGTVCAVCQHSTPMDYSCSSCNNPFHFRCLTENDWGILVVQCPLCSHDFSEVRLHRMVLGGTSMSQFVRQTMEYPAPEEDADDLARVTDCARFIRGWLARHHYAYIRHAVVTIQAHIRGHRIRCINDNPQLVCYRENFREWQQFRAHMALMRSIIRRRIRIAELKATLEMELATTIQAHTRGFLTRLRFRRRNAAARRIQECVRQHRAREERAIYSAIRGRIRRIGFRLRRAHIVIDQLSSDEWVRLGGGGHGETRHGRLQQLFDYMSRIERSIEHGFERFPLSLPIRRLLRETEGMVYPPPLHDHPRIAADFRLCTLDHPTFFPDGTACGGCGKTQFECRYSE